MPRRTDLEQRRARLSPAKKALLEKWEQGAQLPTDGPQPLPRSERNERLLLSFAQERLWFLYELEPDSPAYNIARAVRLSGPLNTAALEQSLNELLRRHEALRTAFSAVEGRPVQVIAPEPLQGGIEGAAAGIPLTVIDLQSLPEQEREARAHQVVAEMARQPFHLAKDQLIRTTLLRLDENEHILLLAMHHIVSDGWSMGVLFHEISALYKAFIAGEPSPLPQLSLQYADYALWQRAWLQGEALEAHLAYWKLQFPGAPPVLELPTDHPRPQVQSDEGARQSLTLSQALTEKLKMLSQRNGATLFMTMLAAFQTLLYRYTGQVDLVTGSPIANRTRAEFEGLIGFFVNTLALRTDLSGNPTFRELLGRVRDVCFGAYTHQDLPLEKLVEELRVPRDPNHAPLFQTLFVFQNTPAQVLQLPGLSIDPVDVWAQAMQFDLSMVLEDDGDGMQARLGYKTSLFEAATIQRMLGHFLTLLQGIVTEPNRRIASLPLLTPVEREQILVAWNDTAVDFGPELCMHQMFERHVERTPEAVAVVFRDQQLTYRQLNAQANQLAHFLQGVGAAPEILIGLFLERSVERVVALLGILKAGAAFVSLDPADAGQHLALKVKDARMSLIVTTEALGDKLPDCSARLVCVDAEQGTIARQSSHNPASTVTPANLAYMIYTSGSTGIPKGVLIEHAALHNFLLAWYDCCQMGPHTHRLDNSSLSYDVWVAGITIPLGCGGVLQIAPDEVILPGHELIQFLQDTEVSQFTMAPSAFRLLPKAELPSLRLIITGGEVVTADLVARWAPGRTLLNGYGPTEATINTTVYECTDGSQAPPIGRPMANMQVYLLDDHLQPVPIGIPGELCIGGVGLARGYLNQPGLTAEKFIPNPFSGQPGARLYRSGDLARYLPDGNIQFLGRVDHQVKIRGFRVELEEIESVLVQHPAVREALLVAREVVPGDLRLAAYVVPSQQPAPASGDLNRFLKERLPDYVVPSAYTHLDALPLTSSGKLDRRAIPSADWSRPEVDHTYAAPRTPVEQVLANIWAKVLGVDRVGIDENFFELGGHSLLATQVISRLRAVFQLDVPLRAVFEAPTVAEMSKAILSMETRPGQSERAALAFIEIRSMPPEKVREVLQKRGQEGDHACEQGRGM